MTAVRVASLLDIEGLADGDFEGALVALHRGARLALQVVPQVVEGALLVDREPVLEVVEQAEVVFLLMHFLSWLLWLFVFSFNDLFFLFIINHSLVFKWSRETIQ